MASVADLDEDTIMAAREAFNLYARGEATLNGDSLFTALRCCSVNPTSDEIMAVSHPCRNAPPALPPPNSLNAHPRPLGGCSETCTGRVMKPRCGHCMPMRTR